MAGKRKRSCAKIKIIWKVKLNLKSKKHKALENHAEKTAEK
jgi:hypothetical protein